MMLVAACLLATLSAIEVPAWSDSQSVQVASSPSIREVKDTGLYDIDASSTDLKLVLESLARCSGANVVVSPDVGGEVTVHLKQMSVESILDSLSVIKGFAWRRSGDTYLLGSREQLDKAAPAPSATLSGVEGPPVEPELLVWRCRNTRPADLALTVQSLFPKVKVVEGPGSITPALAGGGAGGSVAGSSSEPPIGAGGSTGGSASGSSSSHVVLLGNPSDIARAREALTQLDVARAQVSIQVAITEVNSSANKELGVDWSYSDIMISETRDASGISFGTFSREGLSVTGAISALIKEGRANLLAQPNLCVVDGECANILIGDKILFPKLVGYSQTGTPIYDKDEERVGICLQIAPKVTDSGQMLLTLYPQVSLVTSYLKTQAGDYPQISTREARTTVQAKSGQTLAIAGLLRDDQITSTNKVPLLGDLPIIGGFFRHAKKTKERTEIVIFITPTIIKTE